MRHLSVVTVILCLAHVPFAAARLSADDVGVTEVEKAALKGRQGLGTGDVVLDFCLIAQPGDQKEKRVAFTFRIVFDGDDKLRFDRTQSKEYLPDEKPHTVFDDRLSILGKTRTIYSIHSENPDKPTRFPARIEDAAISMQPIPEHFHARVLGMSVIPPSMLHSAPLDVMVGRAERKNTTLTKELIADEEVWRVEYERGDGMLSKLWISPTKGHNLLRAEFAGKNRRAAYVKQTMHCALKKYQENTWYPEKLELRLELDGRVAWTETAVVKSARFGQKIDEKVFTIAGMDVPAGTPVEEIPPYNGPRRVWDGKELVPAR